jgi:predicted ester cyclase
MTKHFPGRTAGRERALSAKENKALIRRYFEVMDRPNATADMLDEFINPNIIMHDVPPGFPTDMNGLKKQFVMFQTSTPGYHTVDVLIAEGDMVAGKVTGYGTHEGDLLGIPRTGKKIQMSGIVIWRIKNGKIVEHWGQNDTLGLLQQLGVLPPLGKAPA